jgi:hypothetical protein
MSIVTGTDFIHLPTRDFERAVEFYGTTLACTAVLATASGRAPSSRPATSPWP